MTQRQKHLIFQITLDALTNSPAWSTCSIEIEASEIPDLIAVLKAELQKIENTTAHNQWEIFVAQMERLDHAYDLLNRRVDYIEAKIRGGQNN